MTEQTETAGPGPGGSARDIGTADTMRERAGESRFKIWLLLEANRLRLTALLALAVFAVFVAAVTVLPPPLAPQLQAQDTIETMFSTMIGAIITGTTLVVTIGQLVLSQENGPLGDQRNRMEQSMDFREYTTEVIGGPSPAEPAAFLDALVGASQHRAEALRESLSGSPTNSDTDRDRLETEIEAFTDSVIGNAETVRDQLDGASFGSYDVLSAALNFNYGWKIFQVERIVAEYEDSLDEDELGRFGELKTALSMFGPAREHVKTLYFEWELVSLSQLILYAAIPALLIAGVMLAVVEVGTVPGYTFGVLNMIWIIGAAFTITLLPFLLFAVYVLRIVTIAKRTLAIEPLVLRDTQG